MATWIVHLRVAENLFKKINGLDHVYFLIGNLGPDLNVQKQDWETFSPPGEVTHFRTNNEDEFWSSDLEFYRKYLSDRNLPSEDPGRFSFLLGYFFHLITDNLWHQQVGAPTQVRYEKDFDDDPDFIWEIKRDWYGLDFIYLRDNQDASFWMPFIEAKYNQNYLDFFPPETIQDKLAYIKSFYQQQDEQITALLKRDFIYLSQESMNTFIARSSARILKIYQQIWVKAMRTDNYDSALDLPI
jgi:hypothetical protein